MKWFTLGYVTHIWVTEGVGLLGNWWDRRRNAHNDGPEGGA